MYFKISYLYQTKFAKKTNFLKYNKHFAVSILQREEETDKEKSIKIDDLEKLKSGEMIDIDLTKNIKTKEIDFFVIHCSTIEEFWKTIENKINLNLINTITEQKIKISKKSFINSNQFKLFLNELKLNNFKIENLLNYYFSIAIQWIKFIFNENNLFINFDTIISDSIINHMNYETIHQIENWLKTLPQLTKMKKGMVIPYDSKIVKINSGPIQIDYDKLLIEENPTISSKNIYAGGLVLSGNFEIEKIDKKEKYKTFLNQLIIHNYINYCNTITKELVKNPNNINLDYEEVYKKWKKEFWNDIIFKNNNPTKKICIETHISNWKELYTKQKEEIEQLIKVLTEQKEK
ncbi:MAG: hypothetical protein ACRC4M_04100 [Mycoplasma sp.]